jgi:hypothetical protein
MDKESTEGMQPDSDALRQAWMDGRDVLWYKGYNGIGDRLHHIAQLILTAEKFDLLFVIDMRDGMLAERGEDAFLKYFTCDHPLFVGGHPWSDLESDEHRVVCPDRPELFRPIDFSTFPFHAASPFQHIHALRRLNFPGGWVVDWVARKLALGRFTFFQDRMTGEYLVPRGPKLPLRHRGTGRRWLFLEVVRPIPQGALQSVQLRREYRTEIAQEWKRMGLDFSHTIGIHIRQTDKSQGVWWRSLLRQLEAGTIYSDIKHVYLATDSKRVVEAFQNARLNQELHINPWISLDSNELPLHLSRQHSPEAVMKSALFDLWTLTHSRVFVPTVNSSFSRVVHVWRAELIPECSDGDVFL